MKELTRKIYKIFMWSYDRGTWQYDLIVCLILAFVFFTPRTFFNTEKIDKRILAYSPAATPSSINTGEPRSAPVDESSGVSAPPPLKKSTSGPPSAPLHPPGRQMPEE